MKTHRRTEKNCILEFFIKCDFHAFLRSTETQDFAKYFHICEMKSKFSTKLKDWNENAHGHRKNLQS